MVSINHSRLHTGHGSKTITVPDDLSIGKEIALVEDLFLPLVPRQPYQGEIITVRDAAGRAFRGRITQLNDHHARVFVFEEMREPLEAPFDLILFQALPEKERMELIIQKVTELGASCICPFKSSHSISLQEREESQPKVHRWQQIALKAAKQSRRASIPVIAPYCSFEQALDLAQHLEFRVMLWEKERTSLAPLIKNKPAPKGIALMVGPEGGWAEEEVQQAWQAGFFSAGLGGRILRTETAAIAACAIIQYEWGGI
jgi:16S rRNA (uracil1498-N3)-methyltransferase